MAVSAAVVLAQKNAIRKSVTTKLRGLTVENIRVQSEAIANRILSAPFFRRCNSVSCFLNMPTAEVDTGLLVSRIVTDGKTLFVPKMDKSEKGKMDLLKVYGTEDLETMTRHAWGMKEPDDIRSNGESRINVLRDNAHLDVIFVPGVAFDLSRSRLGHGKGYYDRFLSAYAETHPHPPLTVSLALREQILPEPGEVPMREWDWKVDCIVTPDEMIMNPGLRGEFQSGPINL